MEGRLIKNRYRLQRQLGEGGMGVVYQAFDVAENRVVAVKVAGISSYHKASARFQREAQAMLSLRHPNIVQVYETGEDSGLSFIVMEYLHGKRLRELIPLTIPDALDVAIQVANALEYAHGQGIIHRDIKPENLMVLPTSEGRSTHLVKVMDFGLARRLQEQFELSESGMLVGTAAYISPEQALGYRIDARADLYALGVVLYEMLVGCSPFPGDSFVAVIYQHLNEPPPSPRKLNPRIPASLEQVILRLLRKEPSERFPSAVSLIASLRAVRADLARSSASESVQLSAPEKSSFPAGLPLVGRQSEFAVLRESVELAKVSHSRLVLIAGEPGIGKTRLAQEALIYARLCRFQVLSAACYEQEGSFPYQPFIDALRAYATSVTWQDTNLLRRSVQGYGGELVALVPEMAKVCGETLPPIKMMSPEQEKARLFEAIRQFIVGTCQLSPVVLFLDDLQWADATSLQLLHYIVRRTLDQPFLILATYRSTDMSQHLSDFLNVIRREKLYRLVTLNNLSPEQSAALVKALLGADHVPDRLQEKIYAETEGNPFFIVETIHHLVEVGLLAVRGGEWQILSTGEPEISASVREVVERRFAHLPTRLREILAVAAVIGREFSFSLLKEVSGANDDDLLQALDRGLVSGLIRERQQRKEEHYDFSHALIREIIYMGLTAARRRLLHRRVGEILEQLNAKHKEQSLGELAHHFSRGYSAGKAIKYSYLAGKQAAAVYATENAFRYFDTARELAEEEGRRKYLVDILEGLGQMAIILGRLDRAVGSFEQAIRILESQKPKPVTRLVKLRGEISAAYERLGRYDEALCELEQGLSVAGDKETVESAFLRGQLAVLHNRRGDLEKAMMYAQQDIRIAEKLGDEEEVAQACTILYKIHSLRSDWESARKFIERALEIWKKRNDIYRQEWNYLNLGTTLLALGQWQEAEENWQKALEISNAIRYTQGIVQNTLNLGYVSMHRGELSQAEGLFREALSLSRKMGHTYYVARSIMRMAELNWQRGDMTKAMELFAEAETILRELGHKTGLSELLWLMADACVEQGQLDRAQKAAEEAIALAPQPDGYEEIGNASRVLAKVHLKRGDRQRARELLHQSIDCLDKLGDAYGQAQARTELANFLMGSGSLADRAQSIFLLDKALSDFNRLRALPDVTRVESMLQNLRRIGS